MPSRRVIHHHSRLGPASAPTTWKMPMTTRNQLNTTDRTNRVMPGQMNAITPAITESRPLTTYSHRQLGARLAAASSATPLRMNTTPAMIASASRLPTRYDSTNMPNSTQTMPSSRSTHQLRPSSRAIWSRPCPPTASPVEPACRSETSCTRSSPRRRGGQPDGPSIAARRVSGPHPERVIRHHPGRADHRRHGKHERGDPPRGRRRGRQPRAGHRRISHVLLRACGRERAGGRRRLGAGHRRGGLAFARAVRRGLEAEGFVVELAADGREGLRMANERPYDAVVLDIMLPGMNGYRVCAAMREAGTWTPVLMLTAKDGELDEAEALDTGADDFLSKPFSFVVLVARLRALARRGRQARPTVLEAGDLKLDPAGHRAWRGSAEIDLTAREFALLELLMRRRGEVLTRREILDEVWDFGFDSDSNIVEVYVGYLRRKVDLPFGRRAIQTVRGVGYRLAATGG